MELRLNFEAFAQRAARLDADLRQAPFALSLTLNKAAEATRQHLIETTWPRGVNVRNASFMKAALTTRGARATKRDLQVVIYDQLGRAHLALHDAGGVKIGRGRLAIPNQRVRRLARGAVRPADRPRNLKRSFMRGDKLFRVTGSGKRTRVELMYVLTRSARIAKDVQFSEDFRSVMLRELDKTFAASLARAMATRRK